jgi:site-specific recombinase XerD
MVTISEKKNDGQSELEASIHGYLRYMREIKSVSDHYVRATHGELKKFALHIGERYGGINVVKLSSMTSTDILQYVSKAGCCRAKATVFSKMSRLKCFFHYLEGMGLIERDPAKWLKGPRLDRLERLPGFLTPIEVERLINACFFNPANKYAMRDYTIIVLFYATGIRVSELVGLTIDSIDLEQRLLRIRSDKACREHFVPLVPLAYEALTHYLEKRLASSSQSSVLFLGRCGRPINKGIIAKLMKTYSTEAGLKKRATAQLLRHTCATHLLEYSNQKIELIAKWLGHSVLANTMIYTHVSEKEAHKAVKSHPINSLLRKYPPLMSRKLRKEISSHVA